MSDELTDALDDERWQTEFRDVPIEVVAVVYDAARGYAEGRQIQWCDAHDDVAAWKHPSACRSGVNARDEAACEMEPMRLCADRAGKEKVG